MLSELFSSHGLKARDVTTTTILSRGTSIGLTIDTEAGLISILAASVVLFLISRKLYDAVENLKAMDILVINLFFAEVLQGLGHALEMKWVIEGTVRTGAYCNVQGAFQQLGEVGVALATLAVAVQSFLSVWRKNVPGLLTAAMVVGIQWLFIILFVAIGFGVHTRPPKEYYAAPTPYWCWIGHGFLAERIAGEYVWFWLTLIVSIALYIPMFLWYKGTIGDNPAIWYMPKHPRPGKPLSSAASVDMEPKTRSALFESVSPPPQPGSPVAHSEGQARVRSASRRSTASQIPAPDRRLTDQSSEVEVGIPSHEPESNDISENMWAAILYPVVYLVLIMPLSVVRWISFTQEGRYGESHVHPVATFVVSLIFTHSGVLNALLYLSTRGVIFFPPNKPDGYSLKAPVTY